MTPHNDEPLLEALSQLHASIDALTQITRQEAELLANVQVEALTTLLKQKESLLKRAEAHREEARAQAARHLGVTLTEHARLAALLEEAARGARDEELAKRFGQAWSRLSASLSELDHVQRQSERLARQGLSWIQGCVECLVEPPASASHGYDRQGRARAQGASFLRREA